MILRVCFVVFCSLLLVHCERPDSTRQEQLKVNESNEPEKVAVVTQGENASNRKETDTTSRIDLAQNNQKKEVEIVSWVLPDGWEKLPASQMVKAKFSAGSARTAISVFPGTVGGDVANVNRWLRQCGQPPLKNEEAFDALVKQLKIGSKTYQYASMAGKRNAIDVAWFFDGAKTYFFKMSGAPEAVAEQKNAFDAFLRSLVWSDDT